MNLIEVYDPKKIVIPKTNAEFWLALLRAEQRHLSEACRDFGTQLQTTGDWDHNHIWHTWLYLDFWLDQAFQEWRLAK